MWCRLQKQWLIKPAIATSNGCVMGQSHVRCDRPGAGISETAGELGERIWIYVSYC
jgi:hypothetical protein